MRRIRLRMIKAVDLYEKLMTLSGVDGLGVDEGLKLIGALIDASDDLGRQEGAIRALAWAKAVESQGLPAPQAALLEYFRANAWAVQYKVRHLNRTRAWAWDQPELQEEILCLRRASRHPGFEKLDAHRQCQVYTNLGNGLNTLGRFVDALEYWGRALAINPRFAMALGNRGYGLTHYARALYDGGHQALFFKFAHAEFSAAVGPDAECESSHVDPARSDFDARKAALESLLGDRIAQRVDLEKHSLGKSEQERADRKSVV